MQISKRLEAVADMVTSGSVLADIGTDHAYIPIYLVEKDRISQAIAMDVNEGPLARAREHIREAGLEERIDTRLSDGLAALTAQEAQSILIAGMGGILTVRILTEGRGKLGGCRELILQPQSDIALVRAHIEAEGWNIVCEEMVCEDGKYYPMMRAVRGRRDGEVNETASTDGGQQGGEARKMTEGELRFGPLLLARRHPVLHEFLLKEKQKNESILAQLRGQTGEAAMRRQSEIEKELRLVGEALAGYEADR